MTRFLFGGESVTGSFPHDALERAKANIAGFWFVGVGERLDDSIILLGRKLEIGLMPFNRKPETLLFPHPHDASAELLGLVPSTTRSTSSFTATHGSASRKKLPRRPSSQRRQTSFVA